MRVRSLLSLRRAPAPALAIVLGFVLLYSLLPPARAQKDVSGETKMRLMLDELNNLGSVMMIAAHPDDENTALLAYLARGRHVRTAYLSLTRGEGGQNLIGPEQGDELGVIRTQELLAARRIDGAQQYFTRAIDFGFTNSALSNAAGTAPWTEGDAFSNVQEGCYWSSTTPLFPPPSSSFEFGFAKCVFFRGSQINGTTTASTKNGTLPIWPVRGRKVHERK